jgi:hypothetical protein
MENFTPGFSIHFENKQIEISKSWFNHYNHNEKVHSWLLDNYKHMAPGWSPVPYEKVFG